MIDKHLATSSHSIRIECDDNDWAFVIVFPNNDVNALKLDLVPLLKAGLILKLFYSSATKPNSNAPSMVFCKVRAKLEALKAEAARINLPMLMNATKLEQMAHIGIKHDDGTISTFVIGDDQTLRHDKLKPYEYIYMKYDRKYKEVEDLYERGPNNEVFTSVERLMLIESIITNVAGYDIDKMKAQEKIMDCFPLHNTIDLDELKSKWNAWMPWNQPIEDIKNYYGTKVAMYFAYLGYYTTFLLVSGIVGFFIYVLDQFIDIDNFQLITNSTEIGTKSQFVQVYTIPIFGVFMALWATFFLEGWKRTSSIYAMKWGTSNYHEVEQPRPQFKGTNAKSPIDGSQIQYFSENDRLKRRVVSWLVLFLMIAIVLALTAGIFYLRHFTAQGTEKDKFVADIHGHKVPFGSIVVSMINLLQIYIMYRIYDPLSLRMNDYENHATESSYEANYILKAIIFHFVNSYSALIYVASLKGHIEKRCADNNCFNELRYCLIIIYGSQIIIGNTKEVLVPRFWAWLKKRSFNANTAMTTSSPAEAQFFKSHYGWKGTFDDYLEMIIQFGYSTFFVVSFPLTPLLSFINNIIEIRVDGFRLRDDCRRPRPRIAANIGLWIEVLETFVTIAIITNGWVIFYTYEYAKVLSSYMKTRGTTATFDVGYLELGLFVAFVTVVLGIRAIIAKFINDVPSFVRRQLARQDFLASKVLDRVKEDNDKEYTIEDKRLATNIQIAPVDDDKELY